MKRGAAKVMALGGVLAALAVVIMCLGGLIPVATFVCPMLCMMILLMIVGLCGRQTAWVWYTCVSILSLLLGPDKEAAAVFLFLGYYPIIKLKMDQLSLRWLWKGIYFNAAILVMYWLLINLFGMGELAEEYRQLGTVMTVVMLIMGNLIFFMLDVILGRFGRKVQR